MRFLVEIGRAVVYLAALLSACVWTTAWVQPTWLDASGEWLRGRALAPHLARFTAITDDSGMDEPARLAALESWSAELAGVRKLDALAPVLRWVARDAVGRALALGDRASALRHARRLVALDDRDVDALGLLGSLLAQDDSTRVDAIALLASAHERAPFAPAVTEPLWHALVASGEFHLAAQVACTAHDAAQRDVWGVAWSDDPRDVSWIVLRRVGTDGISARFRLPARANRLRVTLPPFRACALLDLRVVIERNDRIDELPLDAATTVLDGLRREGGALVVSGAPSAWFELRELGKEPGACHVSLSARCEERVADWLAALVGSPDGRVAATHSPGLRALRARAQAVPR
ncbi:MAG: hypothetical protein HZB39_04735 [Planctomycetes bacterium]|nr:hypothetical protein [Planctomycetota bacterium]